MGFDSVQVGRMSHWHFMAALDGCVRAKGGAKQGSSGETLSDQQLAELGIEGFENG